MPVTSESDRQTSNLQRDALMAVDVDSRYLFETRTLGAKLIDRDWQKRSPTFDLATFQ